MEEVVINEQGENLQIEIGMNARCACLTANFMVAKNGRTFFDAIFLFAVFKVIKRCICYKKANRCSQM